MTEQRIFFPVGYEIPTERLRQFSWHQMQTRQLNDPHYTGCQPNFHWQNYLELQITNPQLRGEVSATLDQIARTPEGQQTIRQAYAMQNYRIRTGQTDYRRDQEGKLPITDQTNALQTAFIANLNVIMVYRPELTGSSTLGADGWYYHHSLAEELYHELCHAKDAAFGTNGTRYLDEVHGNQLNAAVRAIRATVHGDATNDPRMVELRELYSSIHEYPAILETNAFMARYYGEAPRALRHDAVRENTGWNEFWHRTNAQPELPEGIVYPRLPHAPAACPTQVRHH